MNDDEIDFITQCVGFVARSLNVCLALPKSCLGSGFLLAPRLNQVLQSFRLRGIVMGAPEANPKLLSELVTSVKKLEEMTLPEVVSAAKECSGLQSSD